MRGRHIRRRLLHRTPRRWAARIPCSTPVPGHTHRDGSPHRGRHITPSPARTRGRSRGRVPVPRILVSAPIARRHVDPRSPRTRGWRRALPSERRHPGDAGTDREDRRGSTRAACRSRSAAPRAHGPCGRSPTTRGSARVRRARVHRRRARRRDLGSAMADLVLLRNATPSRQARRCRDCCRWTPLAAHRPRGRPPPPQLASVIASKSGPNGGPTREGPDTRLCCIDDSW